ncbi:MAG: DNA repair protein RecN [Candidatus Eremiobacteraeota bacterium]|nr:DNA repair protein RecN [Candidatus Eremiobacteraeota bacterium]
MLARLSVEDFGLIPEAQITFARGATMFTGETGSGKTMVLGALSFVLGERGNSEIVRTGAVAARVSLEVLPSAVLRARLNDDGFPLDDDENAVVSREISASGKSTLRINSRAATAGYLREIAYHIADIVGQHEAQRLLSPSYHVAVLDRFGGDAITAARNEFEHTYNRLHHLKAQLQESVATGQHAVANYEFAQFALAEIGQAVLQPGEDIGLDERRRYLGNVERISSSLRMAHHALAGENLGANDAIGSAVGKLDAIADLDTQLADIAGALAGAQSEINDLALRISREIDRTEFDPQELEAINDRLDTIDRLKRKYGGTIDAVLRNAQDFERTVSSFSTRDERQRTLEGDILRTTQALAAVAARLYELRMKAAAQLERRVCAELTELALPSAQFSVSFTARGEIRPDGDHAIEFGFAANAGQELRQLARVASGGELSRVLLALVMVAGRCEQAALIFDEIDAGIGGATAAAVGVRLGQLARENQVVCVTHLAQLATWADRHYVLQKHERKGVTTIDAVELRKPADRTAEVARMLSGNARSVALQHAHALLKETSAKRTQFSLSERTG